MILSSAIISLLLIGSVISDTPDHVTSNFQIQIPASLNKPGGYEHREALFGTPPYGKSLNQPLYYADDDLCDPTVNKRKGYPVRPNDETGKMAPWPIPFILMMDRGGCSFVQKVRNAQHAGAAGVIIADNICLCTDLECNHANNNTDNTDTYYSGEICERTEPIMADDGSGGDIDISAFLIPKHDADAIKSVMMEDGQSVQVSMSWILPSPDARVEYELWTVPSEHVSKDFQLTWKDVARVFGDHVYFRPREYIYPGERMNCDFEVNREVCNSLCTNNRRYCAMDPEYDIDIGISGADVVRESLRRICIWKHYGESDGIGLTYWDYISAFASRCDSQDFFASKICVSDAMKIAKVDVDVIDRCMRDSGGTEGNNDNVFLSLEIEAQERRGVVILPTMFVNAVALRGALTDNTVISAVCAGFLEGTQPAVCDTCSLCGDKMNCVIDGHCKNGPSYAAANNGDGVTKRSFGFTLLLMSMIFGLGGYIHWKKTREDMRDQVRGVLSEYMPLEGNEKEANGGADAGRSPMDFAMPGNGTTSFLS